MKLTVLCDNNTLIDRYYLGEPGLSFYIEEDCRKILFDTGYSDIVIHNARMMGIDLSKLNLLVLSHGHNDHTGGLRFLREYVKDIQVISHPEIAKERFDNGLPVGIPIRPAVLHPNYWTMSRQPVWISRKLVFLGEIERKYDYEGKGVGSNKDGSIDLIMDDSALAYLSSKGIFIVAGCSHSGICNICEQAKKMFPGQPIVSIIGGFHLFKKDEQLAQTIVYLYNNGIRDLYPCHCVSLEAKIALSKVAYIHEVGVGSELTIE